MSALSDQAPVLDRDTITKNIESVLEHEDERESCPWRTGFPSASAGSLERFILSYPDLHDGGMNRVEFGSAKPFDPYPFPLLSCVLALEPVLLRSFVLIRQKAMDLQSERRKHLDLQINLLPEKETTVILKKLNLFGERLGVEEGDRESRQLAKDMPFESIARDLRSKEKEKEKKAR